MSEPTVVAGPAPAIRTGHGQYRLVRTDMPSGYNTLFTVQYQRDGDPWEDVATHGDRAVADDLYASRTGGVTFRVDGQAVSASDVRASVYLPDGDVMEVVLTNEGTIVDFFRTDWNSESALAGGEPDAEHLDTVGLTYQEGWDACIEGPDR